MEKIDKAFISKEDLRILLSGLSNYQINKIFPSKVVLDEFAFTNDADDEVIGGIKSINIKLNKQEFSVSSTLLNKLKNSNAVTYQTPEVLESNTDYEGIIEVIDVSGNKLKVTNNIKNGLNKIDPANKEKHLKKAYDYVDAVANANTFKESTNVELNEGKIKDGVAHLKSYGKRLVLSTDQPSNS